MSNWSEERDKLHSHYEELARRHAELDQELLEVYQGHTVNEAARRLKTMKLYLKDEMHRINAYLIQRGLDEL